MLPRRPGPPATPRQCVAPNSPTSVREMHPALKERESVSRDVAVCAGVQPLRQPARPGVPASVTDDKDSEHLIVRHRDNFDHVTLRQHLRRNAACLPSQHAQFEEAIRRLNEDLRFVTHTRCMSIDHGDAPVERVLITAPHAAVEAGIEESPSRGRDPLSGVAAQHLVEAAREQRLCADACIATLHRQFGDQNRAWGLLTTADMLPWLVDYDDSSARGQHGGWCAPTLHIDVHSFNADRPRARWGLGVNLVVLHAEPELLRCVSRSRPATPGVPVAPVAPGGGSAPLLRPLLTPTRGSHAPLLQSGASRGGGLRRNARRAADDGRRDGAPIVWAMGRGCNGHVRDGLCAGGKHPSGRAAGPIDTQPSLGRRHRIRPRLPDAARAAYACTAWGVPARSCAKQAAAPAPARGAAAAATNGRQRPIG